MLFRSGRSSRFPTVVMVATFVVGLTPQVIRYDLTILSESIAITLGVAMVASTMNVAATGTTRTATQWVLVMAVFSMVRPQHMIVLFAAAYVIFQREEVRA